MQPVFIDGRAVPIFPCKEKRPCTPRSFYSAVSDSEGIANLWAAWFGPQVGIPTGAASGLDVLDVDPDGLAWLAEHQHRIPRTFTVETPRGLHFYFRASPAMRCSVGRIAPGVDSKGTGGFVVAHWLGGACKVVMDSKPADWPSWILDELKKRRVGTFSKAESETFADENVPTSLFKAPTPFERNWAEKALQNAFSELSICQPGGRNHKLNVLAYSMGRLVARRWLSQSRVEKVLGMGAQRCGLGADESRRTIASGLRAGLQVPYGEIAPAKTKVSDR